MSSLDRKYRSNADEAQMMLLGLVVIVGLPLAVYVVLSVGHAIQALSPAPASGVIERLWGLFSGDTAWRGIETALAVALAVMVAVAAWPFLRARRARSKSRVRHDRAAVHMASGADMQAYGRRSTEAKAKKLGADSDEPGVFVGKMVRTGAAVFASFEDTLLHIWGPRTGKTTSQAAPSIIEAPGPVVATSNKRDLLDWTRHARSGVGDVFVFDPQGIAEEPPRFWWNPLGYVTDGQRAAEMAENFMLGSRDLDSKGGDAFFDSAGKDLLSALLLAAAVGNRPITRVHYWLTRPKDEEPLELLDEAGWHGEADGLSGVMNSPDKQREGVYGTARQAAACLKNPAIVPWVDPPKAGEDRPEFVPADFVRGRHTLYALSKEGAGTMGPLITSLTIAVTTAAEEYATSQGGRLSRPMLAVLDEAANICRWANLPNLYSHYGSRGIVLSTFLQSYPQGESVWGEKGMKKLWSAANIVTYGGNVKDGAFLKDMSANLIGSYRYVAISRSRGTGKNAGSTSRQDSTDEILSAADLQSLPPGRAVVFASGCPAVLVRTVPIFERDYADSLTAPAPAVLAAEPADDEPAAQPVADAPVNRWRTRLDA